MRAHFAELAFVHDEDGVCALHGGEAVGDEDAGAAFDHAFERAADAQLGVGVDAGGGLIEDEDARVVSKGAGEVDELLLAGGERVTALEDGLVELAGQGVNEIEDIDVACCAAQVGVCDGVVAEADIFRDGAGEEKRILQNDGEVPAEFGEVVLAQVNAIDEDLSGGDVVEAHHEAGEGGFAGAGVADDGDGLSGLDGEGDVFEDPLDVLDGGEPGVRVT